MKIRELIEKLQALPEDKKDDDAIIWIEDGDRYPVHSVDDTIDGVVELNAYLNDGIANKSYFSLDEHPSPLPTKRSIKQGESSSENRIIAGVDFDDVWNSLQDAMKPILKDYRDRLAKKDDNPSIH